MHGQLAGHAVPTHDTPADTMDPWWDKLVQKAGFQSFSAFQGLMIVPAQAEPSKTETFRNAVLALLWPNRSSDHVKRIGASWASTEQAKDIKKHIRDNWEQSRVQTDEFTAFKETPPSL